MTAATDMECLSDETLAAFVDGELDDSERAAVTEHLVLCGECRWNMIEAREISAAEKKILGKNDEPNDPVEDKSNKIAEDEPSKIVEHEPAKIGGDEPAKTDVEKDNVRPFRKRKTRLIQLGGAVAAAALIAAVLAPFSPPVRSRLDLSFGRITDWTVRGFDIGKDRLAKTWKLMQPSGSPRSANGLLVKASEKLEYRQTYGRLSGGFPYKAMKGIMRGPGDDANDDVIEKLPLLEAQEKIRSAARVDEHAMSVGLLLLGERPAAVAGLEKVLATNPRDRDAVAQDLAVALLQQGEYERSLHISNELWAKAQTAEVAWNRAYALKLLGRDSEAIAAWNEYLKLDPSSAWAQEAIKTRDEIQRELDSNRNP